MTLENIAVVGLGNIGLRTLKRLADIGYNVVGIDSSLSSVKRAVSLGLKAVIGDASNTSAIREAAGFDPHIVVTALPGSVAYNIVRKLVNYGYSVVDVSFFPEDPRPLEQLARDKGLTVIIDAGIAPGYSNFLVGKAVRLVKADRAYIYVGGLSKEPNPPLNIAATWSTYDLLEEYIRPARMVRDGEVVSIDPLEAEVSIIEFPGLGKLEAFPTDGLRSLIYNYYGSMRELVEYTLRRPGHLDFMRSLARIGFLSDQPVKMTGCMVSPRECLSKIIEKTVSGLDDIVVLSVEAEGSGGMYKADLLVEPRDGWSAMATATSGFQVAITRLLADEKLPSGLVYPEKLGENEDLSNDLQEFLQSEGLRATERIE